MCLIGFSHDPGFSATDTEEQATSKRLLALDPGRQRAVAVVVLAANTILDDTARLTALNEVGLKVLGETPLAGGVDLLAASNLVLGAAKSLEGVLADLVTTPHGDENLANVHASDSAVGLAEGTTHTGLEPASNSVTTSQQRDDRVGDCVPISSSAGKHLVDTQNVERVHADTHVE